MRKTHWELINKTSALANAIKEVDGLVASYRDISPRHLWGMDQIQTAIKPALPASYSVGPAGGSQLRTLMFYALFRGKLFYLAEHFAEELRKVKITVMAACIPEADEILCIELPAWTGYQAVYISARRNIGEDSTGDVYCRLEMQFCRLTSVMDKFDRTMIHFYSPDEVIDDGLSRFSDISVPVEVLKFAVNAYLYIHSGKPDLREYAPPPKPLSKKPKLLRLHERKCAGQSALPVVLVGFDFKKETEVNAHFQGYWTGEGRKNLSLRWKKPYAKGISLGERR